MTRHQHGISAVISKTSLRGKNRWWRREMLAVFQATIDDALGSEGSLNLGIASDWSFREKSLLQPITSTTQIWVVTK